MMIVDGCQSSRWHRGSIRIHGSVATARRHRLVRGVRIYLCWHLPIGLVYDGTNAASRGELAFVASGTGGGVFSGMLFSASTRAQMNSSR
jgi:hypothetical protein